MSSKTQLAIGVGTPEFSFRKAPISRPDIRVVVVVHALATLLLLPGLTRAQSISNVTGVLVHGGTLQITGSGFGVKSPAAPVVWEDFEGGAVGTAVTPWENDVGGPHTGWYYYDGCPYYTTTWHHGPGSKAVSSEHNHSSISRWNMLYWAGVTPSTEIYMTDWTFSTEASDGDDYGVVKWNRINSSPYAGSTGRYNGFGSQNYGFAVHNNQSVPNGSLALILSDDVTGAETILGYCPYQWNVAGGIRVEAYTKLSQPGGTANGISRLTHIGYGEVNAVNIVNRNAGFTYLLDTALFSISHVNAYPAGHPDGAPWMVEDFDYFMDDCYMDITCARIELGNAPTWAACNHREIQIPSAWSNTAITASVNIGSFSPGQNVYVFVVNPSGGISNGFQITGSDPGPPGEPQGVEIND
jgi:hypothetical protein